MNDTSQEKPEWHRDFDTVLGEYTSGNIGVASLIAFIATVQATAYERGAAKAMALRDAEVEEAYIKGYADCEQKYADKK